jgi:hypothetical protein
MVACEKWPLGWRSRSLVICFLGILSLPYCWSMMFSENRFPLFGIML